MPRSSRQSRRLRHDHVRLRAAGRCEVFVMTTGPIDAVVAIHNAFRRDMAEIDAAALGAARGKPGLEATVERFRLDRKSTRLNSSHSQISYAVFCLKKKK